MANIQPHIYHRIVCVCVHFIVILCYMPFKINSIMCTHVFSSNKIAEGKKKIHKHTPTASVWMRCSSYMSKVKKIRKKKNRGRWSKNVEKRPNRDKKWKKKYNPTTIHIIILSVYALCSRYAFVYRHYSDWSRIIFLYFTVYFVYIHVFVQRVCRLCTFSPHGIVASLLGPSHHTTKQYDGNSGVFLV